VWTAVTYYNVTKQGELSVFERFRRHRRADG
jgi:hypothetical protein